ncbi:hypothetical protein [Pseudomonas sp. MC6]
MFDDYLSNKDSYFQLEQDFYKFFYLEVQKNEVASEIFKAPFYNTFFSNGTPFMDGNPIFSVRNEVNGQILRIVLDEEVDELSSYQDKEAGCELVIFGNLSLMDEIKKMISAWIKAQQLF